MNPRLISILESILGPGKKAGREYQFHCPFCSHPKQKLAINIADKERLGYWKCWVCNAKGKKLFFLFKRLSVPVQYYRELAQILDDDIQYYLETKVDASQVQLQLPYNFHPLWKPLTTFSYHQAVKYVLGRGITPMDILRYNIGYCSEGLYANRILVPSYTDNNQLNYFVGRAMYETNFKYQNPPVSKNVIIFENQISWKHPIIVCEGIFDAMAIKQNAIPMLGKVMPAKLKERLIAEKVKDVTVLLDPDARNEALQLVQQLQQMNIDARFVDMKTDDASKLGFENVWKRLDHRIQPKFGDLIKMRLETL